MSINRKQGKTHQRADIGVITNKRGRVTKWLDQSSNGLHLEASSPSARPQRAAQVERPRVWEQWAVITNDTNQLEYVGGNKEWARQAAQIRRNCRVVVVEIREKRSAIAAMRPRKGRK